MLQIHKNSRENLGIGLATAEGGELLICSSGHMCQMTLLLGTLAENILHLIEEI
jgi:hypothetical protein